MRMATRRRPCRCLRDALALARPDGFIRIFVDEGTPDGSPAVRGSNQGDDAGVHR